MTVVRGWRSLVPMLLLLAFAGCYQSPLQRLHGRWFNGDMSIRFQPDGKVFYNSRGGLAKGRYVFDIEQQAFATHSSPRKLTLDVVRNGKREKLLYEVTFLADDRLRLHDLNPSRANGRPTDSARLTVMLRKADESSLAPEALPTTSSTTAGTSRIRR
jgi:hypothetical protein